MYPDDKLEESEDESGYLNSNEPNDPTEVESESDVKSDGDDDEEEEEEEEENESENCSDKNYGTGNENEEDSSDFEDDDEEEGDEENDLGNDDERPTKRSRHKFSEGVQDDETSSNSSDGQSEKCPICLSRFLGQEIGSPESCDHTFCLECISEWSKNMNTCPVDRKVFNSIFVRLTLIGKIVRQVPVEGRNTDAGAEEEDPTYCEVCGRSDREDRLLLCDGCDLGFHLECLTPPLTTVPVEEWFCPGCTMENQQNLADETDIEDDEALALLDDADRFGVLHPRSETRLLPRTRQSERVRQTIQQSRARRHGIQRNRVQSRANDGRQASTSSGRVARSVKCRTSKTTRKRKGTKKRKRITKRKGRTSKKVKTSTGTTTAKRKRRRRKKKKTKQHYRRVFREPKPVPVTTPKARLAEQLGLKKILPNHFLPIMQAPAGNRVAHSLQPDISASSFHLFGQRNELDPVSDGDDDGGIAVARIVSAHRNRRRLGKTLSASAVLSHQPVTRPSLLARIALQVPLEPSMTPELQPQTFDILGSILDSQNALSFSSKDVTIKRDGSLYLNQLPPNSVSQRPVDPVHGSRSSSSGHKSNMPPSQPSSAGGSGGNSGSVEHRWSRSHRGSGSMSEMHSSSGNDRGGGSREGVCSGLDGIGQPSLPVGGKKHDKRVEKELKKQTEDDDIDIYSDIEPGFDNEGDEEGTMDQISGIETLTMVDGHSPVSVDNSQHCDLENEDSVSHEIANCSDDACSEDGLVIDESVKHDDGSESEHSNHSNHNYEQSDGSDDNDLVIDKIDDKDESEGENDVPDRCIGSSSPKVSLDIEDISTCDEEEEESGKCETANNETLLEQQDEGEESVTGQRDEIESCSDSERGRTVIEPESNDEVIQQQAEHDDDRDENHTASGDEETPEHNADGQDNAEDQDGTLEDEDGEQSENDMVEEENEPIEELDEDEQEEEEEEVVERVELSKNEDDGGGLSCPEGGDDEDDQDEEDNQTPGFEASNESRESGCEDILQDNPEVEPSEHDSENEVAQSEASQNNLPEPLSNEDEEHLQSMAASLRELIESPDQAYNPVVEEGEINEGEKHRRRKLRIMSSGSGALSLTHRHQSPLQQQQRSRRRRGSRDYEEGEIVDDSPPPQLLRKQKGSRKSRTSRLESPEDYDTIPRVNIAELPRIPKLKRDSRPSVEHSEVEHVGGNPINAGSFDVKRTGVLARLDAGSTSEISWKKLSQNTRTRNYRAGKPKLEQKHLRLREAKKMTAEEHSRVVMGDEIKKRIQPDSVKEKRKEKEHVEIEHYPKHNEVKEWPRTKHEKRSSSKHDKEKEKHKEKHRDKHKGEKHKEWKEKHKHSSGKSREISSEKLRDRNYDKYEKMALVDKKEKKEQKREKLRKELERIHREEKHREERQQHREHKKREKEKQQQQAAAAAAMVITNVVSLEQSREVSPIESKEVYASGDSIIVNVNFSRPVGKENSLKESKSKDEKPLKNKDKEHSRKLELESGGRERIKKTDTYPKDKFRSEKLSSSKKRELDELKKESKRAKYDESRVTHREVIVRSNQARWNPFGDDPDDPLPPLDLDQKSVGSDSPIIVQDDGIDLRDIVSDSDDDIIEIIPCNVTSGGGSTNAVDVVESAYGDEPSQSPVLVSEEADEFVNYDSASNEQIPCSPPSPAEDNSVYDPFEPTKSPTPLSSPEPPSPPPSDNEKIESLQPPPPLPELPPLPPEPEPDDPAPPSPETELEASPTGSLNIVIQSTQTSSMPVPSLTPRRSPQAPPLAQNASTPASLPSPNLPPQCMPPPISLPNIRVPPPNYIPRNIPPSPGTASVPIPPLRPIGWPVGTPGLLFPPSQQLLRAAGNFMGPPPPLQTSTAPSSHSVTLTQIGTLLHNQAAQLAILSGVRPPPAGMPPPIGLPTLLHPHGSGAPFLPSSNTVSSAQNGDMRRPQQDTTEVVDMDVDSPYSPGDTLDSSDPLPFVDVRKEAHSHGTSESTRSRDRFDSLLGSAQSRKENVPTKPVDKTGHGSKGRGHGPSSSSSKAATTRGDNRHKEESRRRAEAQRKHIVRFEVPERQSKIVASTRAGTGKDKKSEDGKKEVTVKMDETQLKILDELPSSAVEMQVKEKFLKKLNRQERVIEEVKLAIKPYYNKREINKEEYKEILRKSVPKICHNKSGEINPVKIKALVEGYVKKFRYHRKKEGKVVTSKKS